MKYPANQMEFEEMFKTEQDCIDYLIALRWPQGFECPVCGSIRSWKKSIGRFECIDCHTETTVTNGTILVEIRPRIIRGRDRGFDKVYSNL